MPAARVKRLLAYLRGDDVADAMPHGWNIIGSG